MGIEWVPIDTNIGTKAETLELMERTACSVEVCVYRLFQLWAWFSMESTDGTAKATPERLTMACGGDPDFWRAVEAVGWLSFNADEKTATLPGWELRFSSSAKARAVDRDRKFAARKRDSDTDADKCPEPSGQMSGQSRTNVQKFRTIEEDRIEESPLPLPREASREPAPAAAEAAAAWRTLREAWNAGTGQRWAGSRPPAELADRLADAGWLDTALAAIPKLASARYFIDPVHLGQFCKAGFAERLASGGYANPRRQRGAPQHDEKPPARAWDGEAAHRAKLTAERLDRERRAREAREAREDARAIG
jgi:hypothetical protein